MELVELKIQGISYSDNTSGAFALILQEISGNRKLPVVIGGFEAQAIAIGLEKKINQIFQKTINFKFFQPLKLICLNLSLFVNFLCLNRNKIFVIGILTGQTSTHAPHRLEASAK